MCSLSSTYRHSPKITSDMVSGPFGGRFPLSKEPHMKQVTVQKNKLLETLKHNRDEHKGLFEKAQEIYRAKVIDVLDRRLQEAKAGGKVKTYINLPEPVDYTSEFDRAIAMIEWDEGATVTLDERDFQRFVLNNWEWNHNFLANTTAYVTGAVREEEDVD